MVAQLRKFQTAADIHAGLQVAPGDLLERLVHAPDALDNIFIHIVCHAQHHQAGDQQQARRHHAGIDKDTVVYGFV